MGQKPGGEGSGLWLEARKARVQQRRQHRYENLNPGLDYGGLKLGPE